MNQNTPMWSSQMDILPQKKTNSVTITVVPNLYVFPSSAEDKRKYFEQFL